MVDQFRIGGGAPVRLMGVINCSPESFYHGSYAALDRVADTAVGMLDAGAALIDLGARSTAPGAPPLSPTEEAERMDAALSAMDGTDAVISVDTMHPSVLEVCLRHEIHAVNDIGGLANEAYARVVADSGLPVFAMASLERPGDAVGLSCTMHALQVVTERCRRFGIEEYILDPGIGKWVPERSFDDDWELCRNFERFTAFERPLLAAVSRKSFIGDLLLKPPEERLSGSLALTVMLLCRGADVVRCHDVAETADAIKIYQKARLA